MWRTESNVRETHSSVSLTPPHKLKRHIARIGIRLQDPHKGSQVSSWMLALATWRVSKVDRRRLRACGRPIVADVRPQPTLLGGAAPRTKYWHRCIVAVDLLRAQYIAAQRGYERKHSSIPVVPRLT